MGIKIRQTGKWLALGFVLCVVGTAHAQVYYVRQGDTLYTIATRYQTTPNQLMTANRLSSSWIYPGQALYIPQGKTGSGSPGHTVAAGDTLYLIAQRYGVSVEALKQANLLVSNTIYPGQKLVIPTAGSGSTQNNGLYLVQANASLYKIAQRYGITVEALRQANNLKSTEIYVGQTLRIPVQTSGSNSSSRPSLSSAEIDLLARLVTAEAGGESFEGQVAVAATVLRRVQDPRYPNSVKEVIYQVSEGRYYQYSPVLDGRINLPASAQAYKAVESALAGWDPSNGAIGFYNPAKTTNAWVRSQTVTTVIGEHVFFKY